MRYALIAKNEKRSPESVMRDFREWASLFSGKYFAMIVAYADETGTGGIPKSGKEPAPGVYGLIATPEQWNAFRGRWNYALEKHKAKYFHFRELNKSERVKPGNPYHLWNDSKVDDFLYDMAIVAGNGPVPFGGCGYIKAAMAEGRTEKDATIVAWRRAFKQFFRSFSWAMKAHFPDEKKPTSFFFEENGNEEWIAILNEVIKKERKRDSRIGEPTQVTKHSERGLFCQAADCFAAINRQNTETIYENDDFGSPRVLDLIFARAGWPPDYPLAKFFTKTHSQESFEKLIHTLRGFKKLKEAEDVKHGREKSVFTPLKDYPYLRTIHVSLAHEIKKYEKRIGLRKIP